MANGANLGAENGGVQEEQVEEVVMMTSNDLRSSSVGAAMDLADAVNSVSESALDPALGSRQQSSLDPEFTRSESRSELALCQVATTHKGDTQQELGSPVRAHSGSAVPSSSTTRGEAESTSSASTSLPELVLAPLSPRPHTRLQDNIVKPKQFTDGTVRYGRRGFCVTH
jgi:hypothetical protein